MQRHILPQKARAQETTGMILPILWVIESVGVGFATGSVTTPPVRLSFDSYYIVAKTQYGLGLATWLLIFAAAYFVIERKKLKYGRIIAYLHFWITSAGVVLILAPAFIFRVFVALRCQIDPVSLFNNISILPMAGYVVSLLGLVFFVTALARAVRKTFTTRAP